MKLEVTGIKKHDHGFGQYDRCGESSIADGDYDSIADYVARAMNENPSIVAAGTDQEILDMCGDEPSSQLAAALRAATHNVCGGHDTLVAYHCGNNCGEPWIQLESVRAVAAVEA